MQSVTTAEETVGSGKVGGAVALSSGGLDSGTSIAMWLDAGGTIDVALFVDYGQRAASRERAASKALATRWGHSWRCIELPWLADASAATGSALHAESRSDPRDLVVGDGLGDAHSAAAVWVPARNVVLLATAAAFADAYDVPFVLAGFNREEAATFPDNSAEFVQRMDAVLELGARRSVRVASPTIGMDKVEIAVAARAAGLGPQDFWSCYLDGVSRDGSGGLIEPCGVCESCRRSARAWAAAGAS